MLIFRHWAIMVHRENLFDRNTFWGNVKFLYSFCTIIILCIKQGTPGAWRNFWTKGQSFRGTLGDATNQISRIYALWPQTKYFFHNFPIYAFATHAPPAWYHIWTQVLKLNELGRGLLGNDTYYTQYQRNYQDFWPCGFR